MALRIGIKHIIHKRVGEDMTDSFEIEDGSSLFPEDEITVEGNIGGNVHIKKFDTFLGVTFHSLHADLHVVCGRCERPFVYALEDGNSSMREFYIHIPEEFYKEELEDVFLVDTGRNSVDLTEMLRQELILLLPTAPYCSNPDCKIVVKESTQPKETFQPFAGLKDMFGE